jgi:HSP20 family protein
MVPGFTEQLMEPLSWLRGEVDRLFDDFPARTPPFHFGRAMALKPIPAVEMTETDDAYKLSAELPGIDAKDVEITVANGILSISGEKKEEREEKEQGFMFAERSYGAFERRIELPDAADADHIKARFKNGVLTLTVPKNKKVEAKHRIAIEQA